MSKILLYKGYEVIQDWDCFRIYKGKDFVRTANTQLAARLIINKLEGEGETKFLGKPITLINTPTHQRWWLPNRDYWYEIKLIQTTRQVVARHRIVHNETQRVVAFEVSGQVFENFDIPISHPRYNELTLYAQELAEKKFRRPSRRDSQGNKKKTTLFYNVVNVKEPKKALMENVAFLNMAQRFKAVQVVKYPHDSFEIVEIETED